MKTKHGTSLSVVVPATLDDLIRVAGRYVERADISDLERRTIIESARNIVENIGREFLLPSLLSAS